MFTKDNITLLRIPFSVFLMPVFLFGLSQSTHINWEKTALLFSILHLLVYPASNGFNSYMDQDEGSIGGLKHPPKALKSLYHLTMLMDVVAIALSCILGWNIAFAITLYILASRAYSHTSIRLKKYPWISFITVAFFQGFVVYYLTYFTASSSIGEWILPAISSSLLIAGVYPLTQIYQHEMDRKAGDTTLSLVLGYRGTFVFSTVIFALSGGMLYMYFNELNNMISLLVLLGCMSPVLIYFNWWMMLVWKDTSNATFEHTMRMNMIASISMNIGFGTLIVQQLIS